MIDQLLEIERIVWNEIYVPGLWLARRKTARIWMERILSRVSRPPFHRSQEIITISRTRVLMYC